MFKLTFLTPEKKLVIDQEIETVILPAYRGELQILPGHSPLMTTLSTGIVAWKLKGESGFKKAVISWGYCQVYTSGVYLLADIADLPHEIDVKESNEYLNKAESRLATEFLDDDHWNSLQREIARVKADLILAQEKH